MTNIILLAEKEIAKIEKDIKSIDSISEEIISIVDDELKKDENQVMKMTRF